MNEGLTNSPRQAFVEIRLFQAILLATSIFRSHESRQHAAPVGAKIEGRGERSPDPPGAGSPATVDFHVSHRAGADGVVWIEQVDVDQKDLALGSVNVRILRRFGSQRAAMLGRQL